MTLEQLADALSELRRYVRSDPKYVRDRLHELFSHIYQVKGLYSLGMRVGDNIYVGLECLGAFNEAGECVALMHPEILEGYLDGAAFEIRQHVERQRKEQGE